MYIENGDFSARPHELLEEHVDSDSSSIVDKVRGLLALTSCTPPLTTCQGRQQT